MAKHSGRKQNAISYALRRIIYPDFEYNELVQQIMDKYGYTERSAQDIIQRAERRHKNSLKKEQEQIINDNYQLLHMIIDETLEEGDYKNSLKAIDIMNKMGGAYVEKVSLSTDGGFEIKIGNE